jgi:hypothetical protein
MFSVTCNMRPAIYLAVLVLFCGCTKYEEVVVPANSAPPDPTISNNLYEDYVNRAYILAMGREPSSTEFVADYNLLHDGKLSAASRKTFADGIFSQVDYRAHTYEETRFELLQSNDSNEILLMIAVFDTLLLNPALVAAYPQYIYQRDRLLLTKEAKSLYLAGAIDIKEVHRRLVNNFLYDQINMGAQNFVLAVFEQLINRAPTQYELASGVAMINGINSTLFLQTGNTKDDLLNIIFTSLDYHEGQVYQLYEKYLLRPPGSVEMANGSISYFTTNDYDKVQKDIITTNEFAGIN